MINRKSVQPVLSDDGAESSTRDIQQVNQDRLDRKQNKKVIIPADGKAEKKSKKGK